MSQAGVPCQRLLQSTGLIRDPRERTAVLNTGRGDTHHACQRMGANGRMAESAAYGRTARAEGKGEQSGSRVFPVVSPRFEWDTRDFRCAQSGLLISLLYVQPVLYVQFVRCIYAQT